MYTPKRVPRSEKVTLRQMSYHALVWDATAPTAPKTPAPPPLVLLHGWMDVGASYQFMVDALSAEFLQGRTIIAPDWRGFGGSQACGSDHYFFPDYLADLDFLLDHYAADQAVDLVGHSMGGNIAMLYAGVRPERIRRLVNLEGFGMAASEPTQAAARYARWIDEIKGLHRGDLQLKPYDSLDGVARRLCKTNPRLSADKAQWLAQHWAEPVTQPDGRTQWQILGDPAHKVVNPQLYRADEVVAVWQRITAPLLAVESAEAQMSLTRWFEGRYTLEHYHQRLTAVAQRQVEVVADAGHMLHHDQPAVLAGLIEAFLQSA